MHLGLISLIEEVLDQQVYTHKHTDAIFWCPVCKLDKHKKKLVINVDENNRKFGWWKCWNCKDSNSMSGKSFFFLFKKLNASQKQLEQLLKLIDSGSLIIKRDENNLFNTFDKRDDIIPIHLPQYFHPLYEYKNTEAYRDALSFLSHRNITFEDIIKYNIGYCEKGDYANRIIIPSYDTSGKLNYFIGRSFYNSVVPKYKKPLSNNTDMIMFDLFINWNMPIILCEGPFDAIAAKRNAIPVLGSSISSSIRKKIISKNVKEIVMALDMDIIKTSLKYIEKFISDGINVRFIRMDKKDPGEIGFNNFIQLYNKSEYIDFESLIKLKMDLKL